MLRRFSFLVSGCVALLVLAAPAAAHRAASAAGTSVTATGTGQVTVVPKNRDSNASIKAAYDAAHTAAIGAAMKEAHEYALDYAKAAGLTLGSVVSVSDAQNSFYGSGGSFFGPGGFFGPLPPGQFCGKVRRPIVKIVNGRPKRVGVKKVRRCFVPPFASATLTVTYSAS